MNRQETQHEREARDFLVRLCDAMYHDGDTYSVREFFDPDFVEHGADGPGSGRRLGIEEMESNMRAFLVAFPDARVEIEDVFAYGVGEESRISYGYRVTGTHLGHLAAFAPTRRRIDVRGLGMYRVVNERIVEGWNKMDLATMLRQLDAIAPKTGGPAGTGTGYAPASSVGGRSLASKRDGWSTLAMLVAFGIGWLIGDE